MIGHLLARPVIGVCWRVMRPCYGRIDPCWGVIGLDSVTLPLIGKIVIDHLTPLVDRSDSISFGRLN